MGKDEQMWERMQRREKDVGQKESDKLRTKPGYIL